MRPDYWKDCTKECERMPLCAICGMTKKPSGRSAPMASSGGYCDSDCSGYNKEPTPGHLWPGELASMDEEDEEDRCRGAN
jgi:hypothetical protein